jgi:hypothetical protein
MYIRLIRVTRENDSNITRKTNKNISTTNYKSILTMTKRKVSRKIQTSTLGTMPLTPPREGGRWVPRGFIQYDGTKEEEIEALKFVFQIDGSNPYKDDAYNIRLVPHGSVRALKISGQF